MHDHPLVVPAHQPLRRLEPRLAAAHQRRIGLDQVDDLVVELQHGQLQLRDERVLVVARVAEQRRLLLVARQVVLVVVPADQHLLVARVAVVEERVVDRAADVDAVQVEPRAAEVRQRVRVVGPVQAGDRVEGQVVVDELPEVRVAARDVGVVQLGLEVRRDDLLQHEPGDVADPRVVRHVRREPEHPAEPPLELARGRHVRQAPHLVAVAPGGTPPVAEVVRGGRRGDQLLGGPRCGRRLLRRLLGRGPVDDVGHPASPRSGGRSDRPVVPPPTVGASGASGGPARPTLPVGEADPPYW